MSLTKKNANDEQHMAKYLHENKEWGEKKKRNTRKIEEENK